MNDEEKSVATEYRLVEMVESIRVLLEPESSKDHLLQKPKPSGVGRPRFSL